MATSPILSRTPSEARLANLHLDCTTTLAQGHHHHTPQTSRVSDDDLEGLFPSLGKSELEEEEAEFASLAKQALRHLNLASPEVYSPFAARSPLPDYEGDHPCSNPYFLPSRKLYHDGADGSWTPRSFSSSSSSSASSAADSFSSFSSSSSSSSSYAPHAHFHASSSEPSPLAARRGKPSSALKITMPSGPRLHVGTGDQQRTAKRAEFILLSQQGVLRGNFGGVTLGRRTVEEVMEAPSSPRLRLKKMSGFAF
jgi:hypothetical protein